MTTDELDAQLAQISTRFDELTAAIEQSRRAITECQHEQYRLQGAYQAISTIRASIADQQERVADEIDKLEAMDDVRVLSRSMADVWADDEDAGPDGCDCDCGLFGDGAAFPHVPEMAEVN